MELVLLSGALLGLRAPVTQYKPVSSCLRHLRVNGCFFSQHVECPVACQ